MIEIEKWISYCSLLNSCRSLDDSLTSKCLRNLAKEQKCDLQIFYFIWSKYFAAVQLTCWPLVVKTSHVKVKFVLFPRHSKLLSSKSTCPTRKYEHLSIKIFKIIWFLHFFYHWNRSTFIQLFRNQKFAFRIKRSLTQINRNNVTQSRRINELAQWGLLSRKYCSNFGKDKIIIGFSTLCSIKVTFLQKAWKLE